MGGYISIENTNDDEENEDIEFKYSIIYNSLGISLNYKEIWIERLEKIKKYIDEHNKIPSTHDKNKDIESDLFLINIYIYRFIFFYLIQLIH